MVAVVQQLGVPADAGDWRGLTGAFLVAATQETLQESGDDGPGLSASHARQLAKGVGRLGGRIDMGVVPEWAPGRTNYM